MRVKNTTLTSEELTRVIIEMKNSLKEWRETQGNYEAREAYGVLIESTIVSLSTIVAKLEGQLANS